VAVGVEAGGRGVEVTESLAPTDRELVIVGEVESLAPTDLEIEGDEVGAAGTQDAHFSTGGKYAPTAQPAKLRPATSIS